MWVSFCKMAWIVTVTDSASCLLKMHLSACPRWCDSEFPGVVARFFGRRLLGAPALFRNSPHGVLLPQWRSSLRLCFHSSRRLSPGGAWRACRSCLSLELSANPRCLSSVVVMSTESCCKRVAGSSFGLARPALCRHSCRI